jgi:hypothetical protein
MTTVEGVLLSGLNQVVFMPGTWDKRFVHSCFKQFSANPEKPLSDKQRHWIYRLAYKYRRQLNYVSSVAIQIEIWCVDNGYTEPFVVGCDWWAYPPNGVMPVPIDVLEVISTIPNRNLYATRTT